MTDEIKSVYKRKAISYNVLATRKKKIIRFISLARLISFLAIFPSFYYLYPQSSTGAFLFSVALLGLFLFFVRRFIQTEKQYEFLLNLEEINNNELAACSRDLTAFDTGGDFTNARHDYSFDLDLYGEGSIFQFLNRTATQQGRHHLSDTLNKSLRTANEIRLRQEAIEELAAELDWRQHFLAKGKETESKKEQTKGKVAQPINLKSADKIKYLLAVLPVATILLLGLLSFGIIDSSLFIIAVLLQWAILIFSGKTITAFKKQFENQSKMLERYAEMLHHIEQKTFRSALMAELKQKLQHNNESAGSIIRNLQKILHEFEYRQNILVGFTLNSLLLWDLRCAYRLFRWQQHYAKDLPDWFGVIAEIDALISLSNYNYNHPNWAIPEIQENQFELVAKDMGHPLIDPHKCVTNDFSISGKEKMVIITGANMAGKSTFLRTVGVNLVLASCGCRVFANRFNFSPIRVFTNMRTTDNLMNDESYFYAELLRLQTILELLRKGEKLFVILDEMLKGTNSIDKLNGSKELIKQLTSLNTYGIVATHDLGLTELSLDYPEILKNQCFEVHLTSSELTFDYKLTEGVTQTMNATFLMKKMGIIPENKSK